MAIGQSFAPTGQNQMRQQQGGGNAPLQQAIKVLNLRLPKVVGAGAVAPQPLLMSQGSGGVSMPPMPQQGATPGGAPGGAPTMPGQGAPPFGLEEILRRIFQPPTGPAGSPAPQPPQGPAPLPRIVTQPPAPGPGGTAGPTAPRFPGTRPEPPQRENVPRR